MAVEKQATITLKGQTQHFILAIKKARMELQRLKASAKADAMGMASAANVTQTPLMASVNVFRQAFTTLQRDFSLSNIKMSKSWEAFTSDVKHRLLKLGDNYNRFNTLVSAGVDPMKARSAVLTKYFQEVNQKIQDTGKSMISLGNAIKGFGDRLSHVASIYLNLFKKIGLIVGTLVALGLKELGSFGGEFEWNMKRIQAASSATELELKSVQERARKLGRETPAWASEVADGFFAMAQAGYKVNEMLNAIDATTMLNVGQSWNMDETARLIIATLQQFNLDSSESIRVADNFSEAINESMLSMHKLIYSMTYAGPTASAFGMQLEELTAGLSVLSNAGLRAQQIGTGMRGVLASIANPTHKAQTILDELGVSVFDANGKLRNIVEVFHDLHDAEMSASDAAKIFHRVAMGPALLLSRNIQDWEEYIQTVSRSGRTLEVFNIQMESFKNKVKIFGAALQDNVLEAFEALKGVLGDGIARLHGYVVEFQAWASEVKLFKHIWEAFARGLGSGLWSLQEFHNILRSIDLKAFYKAIEQIGTSMANLFKVFIDIANWRIWKLLVKHLGLVTRAFAELWKWGKILTILGVAVSTLGIALVGVGKYLLPFLAAITGLNPVTLTLIAGLGVAAFAFRDLGRKAGESTGLFYKHSESANKLTNDIHNVTGEIESCTKNYKELNEAMYEQAQEGRNPTGYQLVEFFVKQEEELKKIYGKSIEDLDSYYVKMMKKNRDNYNLWRLGFGDLDTTEMDRHDLERVKSIEARQKAEQTAYDKQRKAMQASLADLRTYNEEVKADLNKTIGVLVDTLGGGGKLENQLKLKELPKTREEFEKLHTTIEDLVNITLPNLIEAKEKDGKSTVFLTRLLKQYTEMLNGARDEIDLIAKETENFMSPKKLENTMFDQLNKSISDGVLDIEKYKKALSELEEQYAENEALMAVINEGAYGLEWVEEFIADVDKLKEEGLGKLEDIKNNYLQMFDDQHEYEKSSLAKELRELEDYWTDVKTITATGSETAMKARINIRKYGLAKLKKLEEEHIEYLADKQMDLVEKLEWKAKRGLVESDVIESSLIRSLEALHGANMEYSTEWMDVVEKLEDVYENKIEKLVDKVNDGEISIKEFHLKVSELKDDIKRGNAFDILRSSVDRLKESTMGVKDQIQAIKEELAEDTGSEASDWSAKIPDWKKQMGGTQFVKFRGASTWTDADMAEKYPELEKDSKKYAEKFAKEVEKHMQTAWRQVDLGPKEEETDKWSKSGTIGYKKTEEEEQIVTLSDKITQAGQNIESLKTKMQELAGALTENVDFDPLLDKFGGAITAMTGTALSSGKTIGEMLGKGMQDSFKVYLKRMMKDVLDLPNSLPNRGSGDIDPIEATEFLTGGS